VRVCSDDGTDSAGAGLTQTGGRLRGRVRTETRRANAPANASPGTGETDSLFQGESRILVEWGITGVVFPEALLACLPAIGLDHVLRDGGDAFSQGRRGDDLDLVAVAEDPPGDLAEPESVGALAWIIHQQRLC